MSHDDDKRPNPFDLLGGLGKLGEVVEKLQEVATKAENLQRSGTIEGRDGKPRGTWGLNIRVGIGDQTGAPSRASHDPPDAVKPNPRVVVVRKPSASLIEVHDEGDHVSVLIERPGLELGEVTWELDGDLLWLTIGAEEHELFLPRAVDAVEARQAQGVVELQLTQGEEP